MTDEQKTQQDQQQDQQDTQDDLATPLGETSGWDRERQAKDEIRGLNRKVTELQDQLKAAQETRRDGGEDDVDDDTFDAIQRQLRETRQELEGLKSLKSELEQLRQGYTDVSTAVRSAEGMKELDKLCQSFDKSFGAKHRNAAVEAANKEYQELGYAQVIDNMPSAARKSIISDLLEKHYRKLASSGKQSTASESADDPVNLDSAMGGAPAGSGGLKEGSLHEVMEAWKAGKR